MDFTVTLNKTVVNGSVSEVSANVIETVAEGAYLLKAIVQEYGSCTFVLPKSLFSTDTLDLELGQQIDTPATPAHNTASGATRLSVTSDRVGARKTQVFIVDATSTV